MRKDEKLAFLAEKHLNLWCEENSLHEVSKYAAYDELKRRGSNGLVKEGQSE